MARSIVDEDAARELDLYAENTEELYAQHQAIIANLKRKVDKGRYSPALAPRIWRYWYDNAAKRYTSEFGNPRDYIFSAATRQHCAEERAQDEYQAILNGEYN